MKKTRIARFAFMLFTCCCCLVLKAQHPTKSENKKPEESAEQAQRAIFLYLNQPDIFRKTWQANGLPEIDPILRVRDTISTKGLNWHGGPYCFIEAMYSDELKYPLTKKALTLTIPDSLSGKYRYTSPKQDNGLDHSIIYLFSPLLLSNTPEIFLIQYHVWGDYCEEGSCMRFLNRGYLKFRLENQQFSYLGHVDMGEDADNVCAFNIPVQGSGN